jgi:hypothetical protein
LKALAQNTKTAFLKYRFLIIKHLLNTVKHRLLVEKERGNACRKNPEKKLAFFWQIFLEVSVFTAPAVQQVWGGGVLESTLKWARHIEDFQLQRHMSNFLDDNSLI